MESAVVTQRLFLVEDSERLFVQIQAQKCQSFSTIAYRVVDVWLSVIATVSNALVALGRTTALWDL